MNISLQKQIDLIKKAIMKAVTFDSKEDAEECTRDVIIEYLDLLKYELSENEDKESKLLPYVIIQSLILLNHKTKDLEHLADYIFEHLNLLQDETKDSNPLTVDEILKTMNENGKR